MTSTPEAEPTSETAEAPDDAETARHLRSRRRAEPIDEQAARDLALAALHEITPATTVGEPRDSAVDADGVLTMRFENRMPGYPGWFWTVSLAQVEGAEPDRARSRADARRRRAPAPDWLPWAERLAEYQAAQAALAAEGLETDDLVIDEDDDEDLDDVDDLDAADFDNDGSPILHAGDVDGVDIDELSDDAADAIDEPIDEDDADDDSDDEDVDDDDDRRRRLRRRRVGRRRRRRPTRTTTRTSPRVLTRSTPTAAETAAPARGCVSRSTSSSMTFSTMRGMSTASGSSSHCT